MKQQRTVMRYQNIPKIIHFVWAGGEKLLPPDARETILHWLALNPHFKVYLWVDSSSYSKGMSGLQVDYTQLLTETRLSSVIPGITHVNTDLSSAGSQIQLMDIEEHQVCNNYARYELGQLRPNYGASSDLLRYNILYQHGGAYFDSDVKPSTQLTLENSGFFSESLTEEQDILYVDPNSQGYGVVGNDAFICTKRHPLILQIAQQAMRNYNLADKMTNRALYTAYISDHSEYIKVSTIARTGPKVVQGIINPLLLQHDSRVRIMFKDGISVTHVKRGTNTFNWLGVPVKKFSDLETAMQTVMAAIDFEAEKFGVVRLDDHVQHLAQSTTLFSSDEQAATVLLVHIKTNNVDFSKVNIIQLTYRYPLTQQFCAQGELFNKTYTSPNNKYFSHLVAYATRYIYYSRLKERNIAKLSGQQIAQLCSDMKVGIQFMQHTLELCSQLRAKDKKNQADMIKNLSKMRAIVFKYMDLEAMLARTYVKGIELHPQQLQMLASIIDEQVGIVHANT
jgi:hypothetical protein